MSIVIRKAAAEDIPAVAAIYEAIHAEEAAGRTTTGWLRHIYPIRATAEEALRRDELYVMEEAGCILAAAKINREQVDVYAAVAWEYPAAEDEVLVLHTLVVDPAVRRRGLGAAFVAFYEEFAGGLGCSVLRMDTNERNLAARELYKKLGYREAGIVPCVFNGIPGVRLVCLEKSLGKGELYT